MKFLTIVALALLAVGINGTNDFGAEVEQIMVECLETLNVDMDRMIDNIEQGIVTEDEVNMVKCLLEKLNVIQDGKMNMNQLEEYREMFKESCKTESNACEHLEIVEDFIDCTKDSSSDAPVSYEVLEALTKCVAEKDKQRGKI